MSALIACIVVVLPQMVLKCVHTNIGTELSLPVCGAGGGGGGGVLKPTPAQIRCSSNPSTTAPFPQHPLAAQVTLKPDSLVTPRMLSTAVAATSTSTSMLDAGFAGCCG